MKQNIPTSQDGLLSAMTLAIEAATKHSSTVVLVRNTIGQMTTCRTEAVNTQTARNKAREELHALRQVLEAERLQAREYAMLTRDQLKPVLGRLHHVGWVTVGFSNGFTIPQDAGDLECILERIAEYLAKHPDRQVAARDVTAVQAAERHAALRNARAAVKNKEGLVTTLTQECQEKFATVLATLRSLVKELSLVLPPLDGRWVAFGFNQPGAKERPETPTNVEVVLTGSTAAAVKWDRAPRAAKYNVWIRVGGGDAPFVLACSTRDLDVTLEELPLQQEVEVAISATNPAGESERSEGRRVATDGIEPPTGSVDYNHCEIGRERSNSAS